MTEQFVVPGGCIRKFHNNGEGIIEHIGFRIFGDGYKTCVKYRPKVSDENHKWRCSDNAQKNYHIEFVCPKCE